MRTETQVAAMSCPVCVVPLSMSDRQGIEIDYCPQCRGVWLDRGELDKIIERSAAPAQPAPTPQPQAAPPPQAPYPAQGYAPQGYQGQPHYGQKPYYKKKKSWLEDIFD
jgi:uncharacterized protein